MWLWQADQKYRNLENIKHFDVMQSKLGIIEKLWNTEIDEISKK